MPTAVVTGTTHGIGTVTAHRVAAAGYRLIMLVRDQRRAETLATAITETTGNNVIEVVRCDLSSIDSVNTAVAEVRRRANNIHLLINNAGIVTRRRTMSADGIELMFATNHLGPFVLTTGLLSNLESAGNSRVVNVASAAYRSGSSDFESALDTSGATGLQGYATSKLANILFTLALHRRTRGTGIATNCLHPGVVATNLGSDNRLFRWGMKLGSALRIMSSPERGAENTVQLALAAKYAGASGGYYDQNMRCVAVSATALDEELQDRLWRFSEQLAERSV
ncbi:MAG: SDR family oxidoreductase [Pseudomonadota bacterium]|nr:SDR family oxidoreductase [Pseudomonadota bacterium]